MVVHGVQIGLNRDNNRVSGIPGFSTIAGSTSDDEQACKQDTHSSLQFHISLLERYVQYYHEIQRL